MNFFDGCEIQIRLWFSRGRWRFLDEVWGLISCALLSLNLKSLWFAERMKWEMENGKWIVSHSFFWAIGLCRDTEWWRVEDDRYVFKQRHPSITVLLIRSSFPCWCKSLGHTRNVELRLVKSTNCARWARESSDVRKARSDVRKFVKKNFFLPL